MDETFTIHIETRGDHLRVTIKELALFLDVQSTRRDDALDAAHNAIIEAMLREREGVKVRAS